jgi:high-affinity iron transporter
MSSSTATHPLSRLARRSAGMLCMALCGHAVADVIDIQAVLQDGLDASSMGIHGKSLSAGTLADLDQASLNYGNQLEDARSRSLWEAIPAGSTDPLAEASRVGLTKALAQHVAAIEMIRAASIGEVERAKEWRSVIALPKYASAVDGTLALEKLGRYGLNRGEISKLLSKEYLTWQSARVRELGDELRRLIAQGRSTPELLTLRASETERLADFPESILVSAGLGERQEVSPADTEARYRQLLMLAGSGSATLATLQRADDSWRVGLESALPILLSSEDIRQRERILIKLLRLVPKEYGSGVRDGEITVPLEYQEAKSFFTQSWLMVNELLPAWRIQSPPGHEARASQLLAEMGKLDGDIIGKHDPAAIQDDVKRIQEILGVEFGLKLTKAQGNGRSIVEETALEIRSLLSESLSEANAGRWKKAEKLRLDAYINFDLEIEPRVIPRNPELGFRSERAFLEGDPDKPGIKAALDAHASPEALASTYGRALASLDECVSLVKVGLSPTAAAISAAIIVLREGLEAVVILAALLAGMRGVENRTVRRQIGTGAWSALGTSAILFVASQRILKGLSRYGEMLEAVISVLAVLILLLVTNWVFHKYYWTGWNSRLRDMSKSARNNSLEGIAMIGVGFMTIFREGFETTLFMQSLILEAGIKPVAEGLLMGGGLIAAMGVMIFKLGAKLPYRKMLVYTGILVVFILYTFLGSTVRLFQTVGWLPIHPISGLRLPVWMGQWLGIYPTWEGVIIPMMAFAYVGGAWLWVKILSSRQIDDSRCNSSPLSGRQASALQG